jgi:hypothetical protein
MLDLEKYRLSFPHDLPQNPTHTAGQSRKRSLIVGSAPTATRLAEKNLSGLKIVAINNAWRIRPDIDYAVYASDFPERHRPPRSLAATQITGSQYGPALASAGGEILSGATMAFVAGYWACENLRTPAIGFYGCDMVYSSSGQTHFYGQGSPDPLRDHLSLRSLEAKAMRLFCWALTRNILLVNCSRSETSRLVFPRVPLSRLGELDAPGRHWRVLIERANPLFELEKQPPYISYRRDTLDGPETARCRELVDRLDERWFALIPVMNEVLDTHGLTGKAAPARRVDASEGGDEISCQTQSATTRR